MKFFKRRTSFSAPQLAAYEFVTLLFGAAIGGLYADFFLSFAIFILPLYIVLSIYIKKKTYRR
jgi:hypothetical protein